MEAVFLKLLNMSITAGWLALSVIILRLLLKKAPKVITVVLWAMVGIRLICPFSFESILSLIPSAETIPTNIIYSEAPTIHSGVEVFNSTVNPIISESLAPTAGNSVNPMQIIVFIASVIWIVGMIAMALYTVISYFKLHRKVCEAVLLKDNIWLCDRIDTPFIFGFIRPRIYLPSYLNGHDMEYVIAHERAHLKRRDHLWKMLGFLLLTVYWFNPVIWVAYILFCRDIELACDEKVIRNMGAESKKSYSEALINCSVPQRMISACPVAFGEVGVKDRVRSVLNYKKPALWIIIVAIVASAVVSVCFLTNPTKEAEIYSVKDGYTDHESVDVTVTELMVGDKIGHIIIEWDNKTDKTISYGEKFTVYKKIFGTKFKCKNEGSESDDLSSEFRVAEEERRISLSGIDLSAKGDYVLEFNFVVAGDDKKYTAYIEFAGEDSEQAPLYADINSSAVTWTYTPSASATFHTYFHLNFDLDYTHIEASCKSGMMRNLEAEGQPKASSLLFNKEEVVSWTPDSCYIDDAPENAEIDFTVYDEEEQIYRGRMVITCISKNEASATYEAYLADSDGLLLFKVDDDTEAHIIEADYVGNTGGINYNTGGINYLREEYPQYFDLNTTKGLEVYVWQFAGNSYSCGLLPGRNLAYSYEDLWNLTPTTMDEMRQIVRSYNIPMSNVSICAINIPYSSFAYEIDNEYQMKIEELFWTGFTACTDEEQNSVICKKSFDVDNDGKIEECMITHGPTSGIFTFAIYVWEDYKLEYFNLFTSEFYYLDFAEDEAGVTRVRGETQGEDPTVYYFNISVKEGNIMLSDNQNSVYRGEEFIVYPNP